MKETLQISIVITIIIIGISLFAYGWHEDRIRESDRDFAYSYKKVTRMEDNAIDHGYPIPAAQLECYKQHGMYVKNPETNHWIKLTIDSGIPFYVNRHMSPAGYYNQLDVIQDIFVPHLNGYTLTDTLASCTADGRFFIDNLAMKDYRKYEIMLIVIGVFLSVFMLVREFKKP